MLRLKLAIESLQTHIDYDKKANGMQTGLITIGIAEAETLLELLKEQEVKEQISDAIHETAKQFRRTIVLCKDCAWYYNGLCVKSDEKDDWRFRDADWFCADGERRSDNV